MLQALITERESLVRLAQRIVGSRHDAEDVLQDVAIKTVRVESHPLVENARLYLRRMVLNQATDHARRARRERAAAGSDLQAEAVAEAGICPHARLEGRESLRAVARSLRAMPARTRHVFLAHRLGDEPQKAIALRLRVSPTLVNVIVRDATALCREAAGRSAA